MANNVTYCDLKVFHKGFSKYSEYMVFIVCISGCILNCFNIVVLSRKQMRCPTNSILLSLAVADILVMLEYMPFSYLTAKGPDYSAYYYSYYFAVYIILHAIFSQSFHFISCCITIILALWRYIAVKFPANNKKWCSPRITMWTIFLTYTLCPYICVPILLSSTVSNTVAYVDKNNNILGLKEVGNNTENLTKVKLFYANSNESIFKPISLFIYGVVVKLVPCILLTVLSILIIIELLATKERRRKLMAPTTGKEGNSMIKKKVNQRFLEKEKQAYRTTKMLLVILMLFLSVEFPQAIYGLLNHIIGDVFQIECYQPIGGFLDLIALLYCSINFFLYCIMSQKFREVFKEIFFPYIPGFRKSKCQWSTTVSTMVEL
ncbi:unnamed protein product [Brassicogethes aeneus]|uniref:G-protein coupled receptors family 1 profile domain-containing protein n=1 Tax=Brassicogethes aeneus TaxID=1431903 RepID=A0A9P0AQP5_BRAAE|nr:unnamed protein product [Brassicogethes aeneus]